VPDLPPRRLAGKPGRADAGDPSIRHLADRYDVLARWTPAVLVVLPAVVLGAVAVPPLSTGAASAGGLLLAIAVPLVGALAVRDRGLRIQPALFESWGGRPSEQMLRWRSGPARSAVRRRHELVERVLGLDLPDEAAEAANPVDADAAYEAAAMALRERTRDRSRFPLLYQENVAYGFRRNAYACRGPGVLCCAVCAVAAVALAMTSVVHLSWPQLAALLALDLVLTGVWLLVFTADAAHRSAQAYARQLIASLEVLADPARRR
jgi:hypothetical protein